MKLNKVIKISHPMADEVSVQNTEFHYCTPGKSNELAFFKNDEWVNEVIPEFAEYAEATFGDTRVYGWVPNENVENFLEKYSVSS